MKKIFLRTLCLVFAVVMVLLMLVSCGNSKYLQLGPYAIKQKEYVYLMGIYKKRLLVSLGITENQLKYKVDSTSNMTIGEYLNDKYMGDFLLTVNVLLYSQSLFDEYDLSIPDETLKTIDATIEGMENYLSLVGGKSLNELAKEHGFNKKAMKNVYIMQEKQRILLEYLYGSDYSKVTDEDKEAYYEDNFFHFQVIVVNNAYKRVVNSDGEDSFVALSQNEKDQKNKIIADLEALLIKGEKAYTGEGKAPEGYHKYEAIDPTKSYEQLWQEFSDDAIYPGGYYMTNPTDYQLMTLTNTYITAYLLKENDFGMNDARIGVSAQDAASVGLSGDNPVCGKAFIKRLPLGEKPYENEKNEAFFGKTDAFNQKVAIYAFGKLLQEYEQDNIFKDDYKINEDMAEYTFINVKANELDYYFMYKD